MCRYPASTSLRTSRTPLSVLAEWMTETHAHQYKPAKTKLAHYNIGVKQQIQIFNNYYFQSLLHFNFALSSGSLPLK